ncbi:unnamed protein product [Schistocephalus solidus]|uniref:Serine/threonine-protein kinase LATS2 n=1 Tax=Schistocephalus solidus TaxID=70667 RepID=A0A183SJH6_SCHSO|nr:unnamed protein product [Schistocephalus solidus]
MPMRVNTPPKDLFGAELGEKRSMAGDYSGTSDSRQPRNQVKWAANTGKNMDVDENEGASSYYVVEGARARRSSSATLADSAYQSCFPKWMDFRRGRSQSLPQRRKSCLSRSLLSSPSLSSLGGMPSAYPLSTSPIYNRFAATSPVPIIMPPTYTAQVHMPLPAFAHSDPRFAAYGGGGYGGFGIAGGGRRGGAGEYLHQPSATLTAPPTSNYWHPGSPSFHNVAPSPKEPEKTPQVAIPTEFCYTPMCGDSIPQSYKPPSGDTLLPKGTYNLSAIGSSNPFKGHSIPNESSSLSFAQSQPALSTSASQVKPFVRASPTHYLRPNEQASNFVMAGRLPVTYRPMQAMSPRPMNDSCPPPPQKPYQQLQPQQQIPTQGAPNPTPQQLPFKTLPARRMANPNAQPRPHLSTMINNVGRPQPQPPPPPPPMPQQQQQQQQQTDGIQSLESASMMNQAPPPPNQASVPNVGTTGPQFGLYRLPANKGEYVQLEKRYDWLQQEKSRLESDLSKLPLRGKASGRGTVSFEEDRLNQSLRRIDREVSALRLIMKKYQSNLASQRMELSKTKLL